MADQPGYLGTTYSDEQFVPNMLRDQKAAYSVQVVKTSDLVRSKRHYPVIPTEKTIVTT